MAREFLYKGYALDELKGMSIEQLSQLFTARMRRSIKRGWTEDQDKFLKKLRANPDKVVRTHARDMIVLPEMVGRKLAVHNGKEFSYITIEPEMIGHMLGEYALTRKPIKHSAAGIGATRSTKFISVK
jgi:small subunit ribosomal protein S19